MTKEIQLKDPNTCEHFKEVGCVKDICDCYTLANQQETLEEAAYDFTAGKSVKEIYSRMDFVKGAKFGAKWQAERMYSEEDMINFAQRFSDFEITEKDLEQFKKK